MKDHIGNPVQVGDYVVFDMGEDFDIGIGRVSCIYRDDIAEVRSVDSSSVRDRSGKELFKIQNGEQYLTMFLVSQS